MKYYISVLIVSVFLFGCSKSEVKIEESTPFAIVIHGGSGNISLENLSETKQTEYKAMLKKALNRGYEILQQGGSSIDAVQQTIIILEDSPLFNAGRGSVFDSDGNNSMDSSIMDGKTLNSGACAGVTNVKNPILLARKVMDNTKHVLLSGKGAEIFAEQNDLSFKNDAYFYTKRQADYLLRVQKTERLKKLQISDTISLPKESMSKYGTVGCVALDKNGNIAAGTSTGGLVNKKYGRIGDSPLIGAGTYANNSTCGVSCTGVGEYFIRTLAAHEVSSLIKYKKLSIKEAVKIVIYRDIDSLGGHGGIIALDNKGNIAWNFNTKGMFRAYKKSTGENELKIFSLKEPIK